MAGVSLREQQKTALRQMLNLNEKPSQPASRSDSEPVWKLLIYDGAGQDIISPLLTVKELRDCGVTLHLKLHSDRDAIPDLPAIYFLTPSDDNINRICGDMRSRLYDQFYFNFITPISRQKLEDLASAALQANCTNCIKKVFDQYLNFVSLEENLFVLKESQSHNISYYAINKGDIDEREMNSTLDQISDGLFSVLATLGVVPIIRAPRGNAAEQVAQKLDKKLKENLQNVRNNLFASSADFSKQLSTSAVSKPGSSGAYQASQQPSQRTPLSFQRPLLLLLDRSVDLATPLHHTWTYQALVHDVLQLRLNQVKVAEEDAAGAAGGRQKSKTYDMSAEDKFWSTQKGNPFPQVAQSVQEELDAFRAEEEQLKSLKNAMGMGDLGEENGENVSSISDTTAKITSAVSSLPELLEKKKVIDMHTSIATAVLEQIKRRKLDVYFELEEKLLSRLAAPMTQTGDRAPLELLADTTSGGEPEDKLRLTLIQYLCGNLAASELAEFEKLLSSQDISLSALNYLKRWKSVSSAQSNYAIATVQSGGYGSAISGGTKTVNMFSKLMTQGSQFVMEGVKNFVVKKLNLPVTRIVDTLTELKAGPEVDEYIYLDPKLNRQTTADDLAQLRNRTTFQEAIVFIIGGGNYIEYQNLVDYCKNKNAKASTKQIVYGSTDLVNGDQFLRQLTKLGEEL